MALLEGKYKEHLEKKWTSHLVSVVHLVWVPLGLEPFAKFISSYCKYDNEYEHELVLIFNGIKEAAETKVYHEYIKAFQIKYRSFYRENGQDLEVYFWTARQLTTDYVLFLNSYSEILANGWLRKYMEAMEIENAGAISATGSYMSYYSVIKNGYSWKWDKSVSLLANYRKCKLLIKNLFLYRFYFKSFPNSHLRTNAFIIKRKLFLALKFSKPKKKIDAYFFESGKKGLTAQLLQRGLNVYLVDRYGKTYKPDEWYESFIFWCDDQANLLVSDNQTRKFDCGSKEERKLLTFNAWGKHE